MPAQESRRHRRFAVNVPCVVRPSRRRKESTKLETKGETIDISRSGICFVAPTEWEVGADIECVLDLSFESFAAEPIQLRCRGKVVRVHRRDNDRVEVGASITEYNYIRHPKPELVEHKTVQESEE